MSKPLFPRFLGLCLGFGLGFFPVPFLLTALGAQVPEPQSNGHLGQILYINSYHPGYQWSDDLSRGFRENFRTATRSYEISYEYLDTQKYWGPEYDRRVWELLEYKHSHASYDLVVASDDYATAFLREHRQELFPGVPVVFAGANYAREEDFPDRENLWGINETADIQVGIDLALTLHPETRTIHMIHDQSLTGQRIGEEIQRILPLFRDRVRFEIHSNVAWPELLDHVASLGEGDLVFYTIFFQDNQGRHVSYDTGMEQLSRASAVPIYGAWDFSLGHGIVGGLLTSGYSQGQALAELALDVLAGRAQRRSFLTKGPNRYAFDHRQIQRFNIDTDLLPEGTLVLNQPVDFFARYRFTIISLSVLLFLFGLVILILARTSLNLHGIRQQLLDRRQVLDETNQMLEQVLDAIPVRLFWKDLRLRYMGANRLFAQDARYEDPRDILGLEDREIFTADQARQMVRDDRWVLENNLERRGFLEFITLPNGQEKVFRANKVPLRNRNQEVIGILGTYEDVTERHHLEEQLRQSQKMEVVGQLAGGIAHDFNNMLTAILGTSDLLKLDVRDSPRLLSQVEVIHQAASRSAELTQNLLAFSRKARNLNVTVDIHEALLFSIQLLERSLDPKIVIVTRLCNRKLSCLGDPGLIQNAFMNLGLNARDAMPQGGELAFQTGLVQLESGELEMTELDLRTGLYAEVRVSDQGQGIAPPLLKKIFEPFYTTKEVGKGTGLGLSAVYGTMKDHRGGGRVESQLGLGSTFILYFPLGAGGSPVVENIGVPEVAVSPEKT